MNEQQRAVVQQALELLDKQWQCSALWSLEESQEAAEALRQLLEQPVQEPVACANGCSKFFRYTTPPAQPAAPEGWKLVPVEPTEIMQDAGVVVMPTVDCHPYDAGMVYKAMLAAAPEKG